MKRLYALTLLFAAAAASPAFAQKAADAEKPLRQHVHYLASDDLEGRRTGEKGATAAAGYIANIFAKARLKGGIVDANNKRGFLQAFPYVVGVEPAADGNFASLEFNDESGKRIKLDSTSALRPSGFSPNGEAAGIKVAFAGFGISSSEPRFDDYQNLDVKGKAVLIFDGTPENDDPHSRFGRFDVRAKAFVAKEKGAAAMLLISRGDDIAADPTAAMKFDQASGEAAVPVLVISRETAARLLGIKEAELKTLEGLSAMKKDSSIRLNIGFRDTEPAITFGVKLTKKLADAYNVIGVLEGRDPQFKNEVIVIGAHYDHLGRGGQGSLAVNSSEIHHGADDNASGTAALLELAVKMAREKKNKRTIVFAAFGGEESGLIGSKFYVNHPVYPIERTIAMLNMDMVGRMNDDKLTVGGIGSASEFKALIEGANTAKGGQAETLFNLQLNQDGFGPSDHASFYGKKVPVLFFFTGTHTDYHKPSDTAEKINYADLARITSFVGSIVRTIDSAQVKPTYTVAPSSGTMSGRGFSVSLGTVPSYGDSSDGLVLDGVRDGSPAAKAGLAAGDKIIKLAGKDIRNVQDYTFVLGEMKAGQEYEVVVKRGTETVTLKMVPAPAAARRQ